MLSSCDLTMEKSTSSSLSLLTEFIALHSYDLGPHFLVLFTGGCPWGPRGRLWVLAMWASSTWQSTSSGCTEKLSLQGRLRPFFKGFHLLQLGSSRISSVQSLSHVRLFATPWTAARQPSLSITNSQSLLKLMSIESVTLSKLLILCRPLLLLPSVFPGIRVFSNESALHIRWPKYWSFSFNISPWGLISLRIDRFYLLNPAFPEAKVIST